MWPSRVCYLVLPSFFFLTFSEGLDGGAGLGIDDVGRLGFGQRRRRGRLGFFAAIGRRDPAEDGTQAGHADLDGLEVLEGRQARRLPRQVDVLQMVHQTGAAQRTHRLRLRFFFGSV